LNSDIVTERLERTKRLQGGRLVNSEFARARMKSFFHN
jgi:hypothetical protein